MKNVRLVSLQRGHGGEQLADVAFPIVDLAHDPQWQSGDFLETAAVIENLDLVIACDTALVHLAGALGARGWVALSKCADWRWFEHRDDSPWYPSLQLFRQQEAGDWWELFRRMGRVVGTGCDGRSMNGGEQAVWPQPRGRFPPRLFHAPDLRH